MQPGLGADGLVQSSLKRAGIAWVKFVGTHAQYDRIDVENVNDY